MKCLKDLLWLLPLVVIFAAGCSGGKSTYKGALDDSGGPIVGPTVTSPVDTDVDGVPDEEDLCAGTPSGTTVDSSGCPTVVPDDTDADADGVPDEDETPLGSVYSRYASAERMHVVTDWSGIKEFSDGTDEVAGMVMSVRGDKVHIVGSAQKYDSSRTPPDWIEPLWLTVYSRTGAILRHKFEELSWSGFSAKITGIATDYTGQIYMTGWRRQIGGGANQAFLLVYDNRHNLLWETYLSDAGGSAASHGIVVYGDSIYIVGKASFDLDPLGGGTKGLFIAKYSFAERKLVRAVQIDALEDVVPTGVAINRYGDKIFISAYKIFTGDWGAITGMQTILVKYWPDSYTYNKQILSPETGMTTANALVVNNEAGRDYIYVVATTDQDLGTAPSDTGLGRYDMALLKYDSNLTKIFGRRYGTIEDDVGNSLTIGNDGMFYVGGCKMKNVTGRGAAIVAQYRSDGEFIKELQVPTGDRAACVNALKFDVRSNAYVAGWIQNPSVNVFIEKFHGDFSPY